MCFSLLQCYMAPHNEEDDPAVYRSGKSKKSASAPDGASSSSKSVPMEVETSQDPPQQKSDIVLDRDTDMNRTGAVDEDIEIDEEEEEEEESTLLTVQPGFNRLLLVLRDERVMRFVKYISAAAEGSRWDVCGEYEVGMVQEEDEDAEARSGAEVEVAGA